MLKTSSVSTTRAIPSVAPSLVSKYVTLFRISTPEELLVILLANVVEIIKRNASACRQILNRDKRYSFRQVIRLEVNTDPTILVVKCFRL